MPFSFALEVAVVVGVVVVVVVVLLLLALLLRLVAIVEEKRKKIFFFAFELWSGVFIGNLTNSRKGGKREIGDWSRKKKKMKASSLSFSLFVVSFFFLGSV